jgi:hypothetical protein
MRSDYLNENSSSNVSNDGFNELGGIKKILTFGGDCRDSVLDSATTAYADNDIIAYMGALDVTVPLGMNDPLKIVINRVTFCCNVVTGTTMVGTVAAGTSANEALNGAVTGRVELVGADASMVAPDGSGGTTGYTEAELNLNSAAVTYAMPGIVLPVATKYVYFCTGTAINHATNFDAGRYNVAIEYTVI